jgi:HAD superfamily hydrolase (TIGR01509 family)
MPVPGDPVVPVGTAGGTYGRQPGGVKAAERAAAVDGEREAALRGSEGDLLAVVWDMDGTLIDSTEVVTAAYIATVAALGGPPTTAEAVVAAYPLGPPALLLAHLLGRATSGADVEAYLARLRAAAPSAPPYPGIRETLERLRGRVGLGVFTGANRESAMILLEATGLADSFGVVVGGDQVERVKPAPDGVLVACRALGVAPASAAYVGDSPSDLGAARASGARAFAAGWGHLYRPDEPADRVLARPEELLALVGA